MRALAGFVMRGRLQACLIALVGNLVPLISPATVGLVTLRRSMADGLLVLLWACLPLLVTLYFSDVNRLIVAGSVAGTALVLVAAEVLKKSFSWQVALLVVLISTALTLLSLAGVLHLATVTLVDEVQLVLDQVQKQGMDTPVSVFHLLMGATALGLGLESVTKPFVLGFMSWLTAMHVIGSLLLARWWQAMLYNPGGFQKEFHAFRLDRVVALLLVIAIIGCNSISPEYSVWANMPGLPLLLAGLALVHFLVKDRGMKSFWLVLVYVGLVLFGPLSMVLIGIGVLDSVLDLRTRLTAKRS